jgi:lipopolysaccharide biosynthesis glycosyltransferase
VTKSIERGLQLNDTIHVAYAFNNKYSELACVSMASALSNSVNSIHFHVLESELSLENKKAIKALKNTFPTGRWTFHHVSQLDEIIFKTGFEHISIETYYRLLLPNVLTDIDKVIYIDCDTLVLDDISVIWNFDLSGSLAAAVPYMWGAEVFEKAKCYGIDWYFNAGVLLLDLRLIRESGVSLLDLKVLSEVYAKTINAGFPWYADEAVLNVILNRKVLKLPARANSMYPLALDNDVIPLTQQVEARKKPLIVHFGGYYHPFSFRRQPKPYPTEYINKYYHYKAMTLFNDADNDLARINKYKAMQCAYEDTFILNGWEYMFNNLRSVIRDFAEELTSLLGGKKLVLWGAGDAVCTVILEFAIKDVYPDLIVDGAIEKQGTYVFDYVVHNPKCLNGKCDEYFVVLSMLHKKPANEVGLRLQSFGYDESQYQHITAPLIHAINETW